jgi:hypothetical protein
MEVLIHFIFELVKVSMLGSIYALLILLIFLVLGLILPNIWISNLLQSKKNIWFISWGTISLGLFIFMFTYWGDHGLGDSARIPIGKSKAVNYGGGAYIIAGHGNQISFEKFTFDSNRLYADTCFEMNGQPHDFIVYDLNTSKVDFYDKSEYNKIAKENKYPSSDKFEDFWTIYHRHWSGWRLLLLP